MTNRSNSIFYHDKTRLRCTLEKACYARWLVEVEGRTLTYAGVVLQLGRDTISRIMRRKIFPDAYPIPPQWISGVKL